MALRYRDFRLLWIGRLFSNIGSQMQLIAINWHIFSLLRDQTYTISILGREFDLGAEALGLGAVGLVRVVPIILFALLGGILADSRDRRKLLIGVQTTAALLATVLAVLTLTDRITIWWIYALTAAGAAVSAFEEPARQSLTPNLVPRAHFANAVSLDTLLWYLSSVVGPALAGALVGAFDVGLVYALNAVSFATVIISLLMLNYRGQASPKNGLGKGLGWAALVEGLRFTFRQRLIWSTMLLDFWATFFSSARTMLPIVAGDVLKVGVQGYGLLATAQPLGAIIAGGILAFRKEIKRQGVVLLVSVAVYGAATAVFGLSTVFALSYVLFALTGAGDTVSTVIRGTLRQMLTPDRLRGRMTSVNMVFFMGGPQLGELEAGLVAAAVGAPFAIVTGGIATIFIVGWIAWRYPGLRQYDGEIGQENDGRLN